MKKIFFEIERYTKAFWGFFVVCIAWVVLRLFRGELLEKNIWLVCEKRTEARDNGYHFYKYLKEKHPEINSYYVITQDAADRPKVDKLGNIIFADSFKHALYYIAATRSISSQPYGAFPFEFTQKELRLVKKLCNPLQKTIFLQHGIIKDAFSHSAFDYGVTNIDYFVCSVSREYEFVKTQHGYPEGTIGCIGLCRFDNLHKTAGLNQKIILVMPTWRKWLARQKKGVPLKKSEIDSFSASDFYKQYAALMSNKKLLEYMRKHEYKLYFYVHYQLQDFSKLLDAYSNEQVVIADRYHYDVQDLLIRSSIMVTDYSSVQFDFAYMNKPLVYFQFDKGRFESDHYAKGYFTYEKDGFGPCCKSADEVCKKLCELISTGGKQPDVYQKRIDHFFDVRDDRNCERTFNAIRNL